jgi:phosphopantothenoylcysteine decarboxylase/phosphopantothenate--cysteine ligase
MELPGLVRVGFAAETQDLVRNAHEKLERKRLDMIVANDAVASIGSDESALTLIRRGGAVEELPPMPKRESAGIIVARIADMLGPAKKYHAEGGEST